MSGILIVEDDSNILELLKETILGKTSKFTILEASDPVEALAVYERNKFKINYLICDYLLPIQNGRELIDIIKEHSPAIKICIFTGDSSLEIKNFKSADVLYFKHDGLDQVLSFLNI